VANVDDGHHTGSFVDPVDHPVGSAARAEPVLQWREQPVMNSSAAAATASGKVSAIALRTVGVVRKA
jgi:hypothetical protein